MRKFFDRKDAYETIESAIRKINNRKPTAVWIEGQSGVGKTYLLEYIYDKEKEINFFTFNANEVFYKCESGSLGSSFEYIAAVIFQIQKQDPRFFERYIQDYFDSIQHISFFDACCLILPQIKGLSAISNLINTKYKNIAAMQGKISDRLVTLQLIDLFSNLILEFLRKVYKLDEITFCIDDAQWLDRSSMRVIEVLIKKSRLETNSPIISIFLDIREKSILSDEENQNYRELFRIISNLYPDLKTIYLKNFNYATTCEMIQETNRVYLIQQLPSIYKVTDGNPLELAQTLYFPDEKIQEILQKKFNFTANTEDTFTVERIAELYYQKPIYTVLLSILSILRRNVSIQLLFRCMSDLYPILFHDVCSYPNFLEALDYLTEKQYIVHTALSNKISLKHDSTYQVVLDYLSQNGDYVTYSREIATTLLNTDCDSFLKIEAQRLLALKLLCEVDPQECLKWFYTIYQQNGEQMEAEFFLTEAIAFCSAYLELGEKDLCFAVQVILPKLISSANLDVAQRVCHVMYMDFDHCLSTNNQITYLINYVKAQIDLSDVNNGPESAVPLFNKLYKLPTNSKDLKLQILLLGMSAYEHLLSHDRIKKLYMEAETLVQQGKENITSATMAVFHRNKGLCFPHSELKSDYFRSLYYSIGIPDIAHRQLMFGTSMNNLGLSYFYSGDIEKAMRAFAFSKRHLSSVGYNTARIDNNIGTCHYMLRNWQSAYEHFSMAAAGQSDGIFMRLCIQTNLALALYSIEKNDDAKSILDDIINEYKRGKPQSQDTLVYCAAFINRGYISFQERDYFKAAECYQMSLMHNYRYQNKEQLLKRKSMRDISLQCGMGLSKGEHVNMDLADNSLDFYKKPYSLVPFAFYVV